jgi:hypothetical protein
VSDLLRGLAEDIRRELGRFGAESGLGDVVAAWPGAVGAQIAANAWPARIGRDRTLYVAAASSSWAFELTQLEQTIRTRLAEALGDAAPPQLRFAVGPLPARGAESVEKARRNALVIDPDLRAEGERIAAEIGDPELRSAVARAAAASLAAGKAGRGL